MANLADCRCGQKPRGQWARSHGNDKEGEEEERNEWMDGMDDKDGMVSHSMVWCGMVWYGMVWCGVVWYR